MEREGWRGEGSCRTDARLLHTRLNFQNPTELDVSYCQ